jgi:hypothetical protein
MRAISPNLARIIATRLDSVVPAPFRLNAQGGRIEIYVGENLDSSPSLEMIVDDQSRELAERLETAVSSVLSQVQDAISEHLRTPWPSVDGRHMALPGVRVDAELIHLWYGDERAPVLRISAVKIADIIGVNGQPASDG